MRVYAVCRKCAEVHLADDGCKQCARRAALAWPQPSTAPPPRFAVGTRRDLPDLLPSGPRPEPTSVAMPTKPQRRWHIATGVVAIYLIAVFSLLIAALGDCA